MRKKLFIMTMAIVLIVTLFSGIFISLSVMRLDRDAAATRMTDQARLIAYEAGSLDAAALPEKIESWAAQLNAADGNPDIPYRITVIDRSGAVLADSDAVAGEMENHLTRPEVQQALQTGQGADLRFSETVRHTFLYVATATPDGSRIVRLAILMDELRRTENAILLWTALSCVLGLVVAVLLSIPLGSHFIAPIARLRKATRAIADGEYDHRAPAEADEIGLLAQDFNGMAAQLQRVIEHERLQNAQLDSILQSTPAGIIAIDQAGGILLINREAQRIFALHQLPPLHAPLNDWVRRPEVAQMMHETLSQGRPDSREYEIGEKALALYTAPIFTQEGAPATGAVLVCEDITALKKLEQMRTEFVSNVTHELKTPLTSIRGTIETLRTIRPMDEQLQDEMLEIMDLQSERLQALIDDLLSLAEIEHDKEIGEETCDLGEQASQAVSLLRSQAESREVSLSLTLDGQATVQAPAGRIRRMVINLVDNAIKYNREGGSVKVQVGPLGNRARLIVSDTGIGIAPEHQSRIFERFYRVDKGRSREMGGTGLGLSIVKHLVSLYGGDIYFNSIQGEGTTFTVELPLVGNR